MSAANETRRDPWRIMDPVRGRIRFAIRLACASAALSEVSSSGFYPYQKAT